MPYCSNCGKQIGTTHLYCGYCGRLVNYRTQVGTTPAQDQQEASYSNDKNNESPKRMSLPVGKIMGILLLLVGGYFTLFGNEGIISPLPEVVTDSNGFQIYTDTTPPYSLSALGKSVTLINNPNATDPTWAQLENFLRNDATDREHYVPSFVMCGYFAMEVHNNAEQAGIKAAWVAINFKDDDTGHAINAFMTTDKGLAFVDCTGGSLFASLGRNSTISNDHDKIAYVALGSDLGAISLSYATSPNYSFYSTYNGKVAEYEQKLASFNAEVSSYTLALGGRKYLPEPEYSKFVSWAKRIDAMEDELNKFEAQIGTYTWESLGIVESVEIYW